MMEYLLAFGLGAALLLVAGLVFYLLRRAAPPLEEAGAWRGMQAALQDLAKGLGGIEARLRPMDDLALQLGHLQEMLSNRQARGAFGEMQLREIILAALPENLVGFQETLSNGTRVDCLLKLDYPPGPLAIDSKFPLEGFRAFRAATEDAARQAALRQMKADTKKHVLAIKERYIIAGETAELALLFVPSEAVYSEIHASLPEIVEESHHARVMFVSPGTLMALIITIRGVLKDVRMAEKADEIRDEVRKIAQDVEKMMGLAQRLASHFQQMGGNIEEMQKMGGRMARRAEMMGALEGEATRGSEPPKEGA